MAIIGSSSNPFHIPAEAGSSNAPAEVSRERSPSATRPEEEILTDMKKVGAELANLYQQHGTPNQRRNARAPTEAELRRSDLHVHGMRGNKRTATVSFKDQKSRPLIWSLNRNSPVLNDIERKAAQYDKLRKELRAAQSLTPRYKQNTPIGEERQQYRSSGNRNWLAEVPVGKPEPALESMPQSILRLFMDNMDAVTVKRLILASPGTYRRAAGDARERLKVLAVESDLRQMPNVQQQMRVSLFDKAIAYIKDRDVRLGGSNRLYIVTLLVKAYPLLVTVLDMNHAFKAIGDITESIDDSNLRGQGIECIASNIFHLVDHSGILPDSPQFREQRLQHAAVHFNRLTGLTANISNKAVKTSAGLSLVSQLDIVNCRTGRVERFVNLANIFADVDDAKLMVQGTRGCGLNGIYER